MPEHGSEQHPTHGAGREESARVNKSRGVNKTGKPKKKPRGNPKSKRIRRAPRATAIEVEQRISDVLGLIVAGHTRERSILQALAEMKKDGRANWSVRAGAVDGEPLPKNTVAPRTLREYMGRALAQLQSAADEQRSVAKGKCRARYERALVGAVAKEDWDAVRKINRDLARLDGLEPSSRLKVEHEGTVTQQHTGTVEQRVTAGGTIEERATIVAGLFDLATRRRAQAVATAASN
jgi:hypothetical protein